MLLTGAGVGGLLSRHEEPAHPAKRYGDIQGLSSRTSGRTTGPPSGRMADVSGLGGDAHVLASWELADKGMFTSGLVASQKVIPPDVHSYTGI